MAWLPDVRMRLIGRNDVFLLVGLAIALFAIFSGPLGRLLDFVSQIDDARGYRLLPGLVILAVVYIIHQQRKRVEMRAAALSAEMDARLASARAAEMERLVAFGQALARSLDQESIRNTTLEHLPLLAAGRSAWVMTRTPSGWELLAAAGNVDVAVRERAARRALGDEEPNVGETTDEICFPMIVAGTPLGVLGVSQAPDLAEHQRIALAAAAALLAVSLKNAQLFTEVKDTSIRDSLTGCFTRKHALQVIDGELRRSARSHSPLSLVMFDLDHFKAINDKYGHLCGDAVLTMVGRQMTAVLRGSDLRCRYGGEEFLILLTDSPLGGARRVAESLRGEIEANPLRWNETIIRVTASFGIAAIAPGELDANLIIGRADAALYRAKAQGRNCVRAAEGQEAIA